MSETSVWARARVDELDDPDGKLFEMRFGEGGGQPVAIALSKDFLDRIARALDAARAEGLEEAAKVAKRFADHEESELEEMRCGHNGGIVSPPTEAFIEASSAAAVAIGIMDAIRGLK